MCTSLEIFTSHMASEESFYRSVPVCLEMCTSLEILIQTWNSEETLQECSSVSRDVYKSGVFYSRHVLWRNHCRSVPVCPEMHTSPECFTPDMDFKETLQECSSVSGDAYKSGVFYSRHGLQRKHSRSVPMCPEMCTSPEYFTPDMYSGGITAGVFQCVRRCIQVRSVLLQTWTSRKHSRSVPACAEMCTSPEIFTSHWLQRNNSRSVPVCLEMCTSSEILLRTWNSEETLQECSNVSRDVYKSGVFYSGHVLWRNHCRSVPVCLEMHTSPECFTPDMDFKEMLQECSSMCRDVHKSGYIYFTLAPEE
jgi:phosphoribosyl-AMP cyclohydrolase